MGFFSNAIYRVSQAARNSYHKAKAAVFGTKEQPIPYKPGEAESIAIKKQADKLAKFRQEREKLERASHIAVPFDKSLLEPEKPVRYEPDPNEDLYEPRTPPSPQVQALKRQAGKLVRERVDAQEAARGREKYSDAITGRVLAEEGAKSAAQSNKVNDWMFEDGANPPRSLVIKKTKLSRKTRLKPPWAPRPRRGFKESLRVRHEQDIQKNPTRGELERLVSQVTKQRKVVAEEKEWMANLRKNRLKARELEPEGVYDFYKSQAQAFQGHQQAPKQELQKKAGLFSGKPLALPVAKSRVALSNPQKGVLLLESKAPIEFLQKIYRRHGLPAGDASSDLYLVKRMAKSRQEDYLLRFAEHLYRKSDHKAEFPHLGNLVSGKRYLENRKLQVKRELGMHPDLSMDEKKAIHNEFSRIQPRLEEEYQGTLKKFIEQKLTHSQRSDLQDILALQEAIQDEHRGASAADSLFGGQASRREIPPTPKKSNNQKLASGQEGQGSAIVRSNGNGSNGNSQNGNNKPKGGVFYR